MQQLTQKLKNGDMQNLEVPFPALNAGQVLVRNHYSLISAGTEGKTVANARESYIKKASSRQKEVKEVIQRARQQGVVSTYKAVMNKLDAPSSLGYSCAGEVIAVGCGVTDLQVGNFAACAGSTASHAEIVSIPRNLCVKIPDGVSLKHAAFSALAAIAMQGVRQADLRLGENCVIIGLGLVGQLTIQLLRASGVRAFGIDIDVRQVALAEQSGASLVLERSRADLEQEISRHTDGHGADAVIITAGTSSSDPVELAGALCRKKGKVIIVGAVPTGFSRPNYYNKELELRMSCSYGPGRYDSQYEEKGLDYPIAYVRWTENRNMQAYLQLLQDGKLDIDKLITHEFELERASEAYAMILERSEPFAGILLKYDIEKEIARSVRLRNDELTAAEAAVGFIGAGSFAQNVLLPNVRGKAEMVGVATARGNTARNIADKFGFLYATGDADELITDDKINTVFIATRHDSHAGFVIKALERGKSVFVEKPLALNLAELADVQRAYDHATGNGHATTCRLMVGFNRRFAPHVQKIIALFPKDAPKAINYRINAGAVPATHWVNDPEVGGGRIIGEVCHFIDLCSFIAGSRIATLSASCLESPRNTMDSLVVNLNFCNGSIASISYFSNGNRALSKECLEVFCGNQVAVIKDFKEMIVYSKRKTRVKLRKQDKGHAEEVRRFLQSVRKGDPSPIAFDDLIHTSLATFKIIESIQKRQTVSLV